MGKQRILIVEDDGVIRRGPGLAGGGMVSQKARRHLLLSAALAMGSLALAAVAQDDEYKWWGVDRALVASLFTDDLIATAQALAQKPPPSDPADTLRRLDVFVRAGRREDAMEMIDVPPAATWHQLRKYDLDCVGNFLYDHGERDLALRFLERFPQTEIGAAYHLMNEWGQAGASPEEIDRWLAARTTGNPHWWVRIRMMVRGLHGTQDELLTELANEVKANPADMRNVRLYLVAASEARKRVPLDWLAEVAKPKLAIETHELAGALSDRATAGAVALLERSLDLPLTPEDLRVMGSWCAKVLTEDEKRDRLRRTTKATLAKCYLKLGKPEKAQPLVEELVGPGADAAMLDAELARLAGHTQADSGQRVIEGRLKAREADSPRYWLARAQYYVGRKEQAQAVEAFEKALELAPVEPPPNADFGFITRLVALGNYGSYLVANGHATKACELYYGELARTQLESDAAWLLVCWLLNLDEGPHPCINAGNALLWRFLEKRKRWDSAEERLLKRLLKGNDRAACWQRAEVLAASADPSRAKALGSLRLCFNEPARAIPLLEDAVKRLESVPRETREDQCLRAARSHLFCAYVETGNWKGAERIFPLAFGDTTSRELTHHYAKIAVLAAKAGARDDALRLWRRTANFDLTDLRRLDELVLAGMGGRLRRFYLEVKRREPASWVPHRALELLKKWEDSGS